MPHKRALFHSAAREKILRGATALADAVRITLGPKSKSVLMQAQWGASLVCNDCIHVSTTQNASDYLSWRGTARYAGSTNNF